MGIGTTEWQLRAELDTWLLVETSKRTPHFYVTFISPRPVRCAYASRGVSLRQHSIKLYTFVYKFISNLYYLNKIAFNNLFIITRFINKGFFISFILLI
jgi:hypothetical protein